MPSSLPPSEPPATAVSAGPRLIGSLSAERARRILDARTRDLARTGEDRTDPQRRTARVLICALGRERYGLPATAIGEVTRAQPCTPVPGSPPAVIGLFGRGGHLVSVLDLARLIGSPAQDREAEHFVVLRRSAPRLALALDRALDLTVVDILPEPPDARGDDLVSAHAHVPGETGTVALLDLDRLLRPFLSASPGV